MTYTKTFTLNNGATKVTISAESEYEIYVILEAIKLRLKSE